MTTTAPDVGSRQASAASVRRVFSAMATSVEILVEDPGPSLDAAVARVEDVFLRVEAACTRFDPDSPLMQANGSPMEWHAVPDECFEAVLAAANAHQITGGVFDPRILTALVSSGYDRALPFREGEIELEASDEPMEPGHLDHPWVPEIDVAHRAIRLGPHPIDLGGIGKSFAVMRAVPELYDAGTSFLINAGGDCYIHGGGASGEGWLIGVEDPHGGASAIAVLRVSDAACATSSTRLRKWRVNGRDTHHLVDPRTGRSGGDGLAAVTVVASDTITAETWSKALFLTGPKGIGAIAAAHDLAALWVDSAGEVGMTEAMAPLVAWRA